MICECSGNLKLYKSNRTLNFFKDTVLSKLTALLSVGNEVLWVRWKSQWAFIHFIPFIHSTCSSGIELSLSKSGHRNGCRGEGGVHSGELRG